MAKAVKQNELAKDLELYIKIGKYSNFASVKKSPRDKVTYVDYLNTSYKKMQNMLDDLQDSYFDAKQGNYFFPIFIRHPVSLKLFCKSK